MNNMLTASGDYLYPILKTQPELTILKFNNMSTMHTRDSKAIGKVLADFMNIREVDVSNCGMSAANAKDIADGIMRAKKLEVFKAG